jgi:hypothetical protein
MALPVSGVADVSSSGVVVTHSVVQGRLGRASSAGDLQGFCAVAGRAGVVGRAPLGTVGAKPVVLFTASACGVLEAFA